VKVARRDGDPVLEAPPGVAAGLHGLESVHGVADAELA
jgi:hypothetical protein